MHFIKKIRGVLVLLLLCLIQQLVNAQDSGGNLSLTYFNKTEAGAAFGLGSIKGDIDSGAVQHKYRNDQLIFPIETINGFVIGNRVGIGLGVGVEFWKNAFFVPVFGHLYYDFKPTGNTFFGSLNLGSAIGNRKETAYQASGKGGFLFSLGVGYRMEIAKRLQLVYELYYRYQAIDSHYTVYFDSARKKSTTVDEKFPYQFLGFKIGIFFH
jgi:hypothetical protein